MTDKRIGVFICYCGGNISDFIDVERVRETVETEPGVVVAKTHMFTCSDASQQEIIEDIGNDKLDAMVIASCSPKLHLLTFRMMAERAGLNPYQYIQVNLREQCSWAHRDDIKSATDKAVRLVRAGIAKSFLCEPLVSLQIQTTPRVLVVGAGVAGLRASLALSELGLIVYLVEKAPEAGGWTGKWGKMFPHEQRGSDIIRKLMEKVMQQENITLFTNAEVVEKSGSVGEFSVKVRVVEGDTISLLVGAVIVTTGFEPYKPADGEFGYGLEGVLTLPEFKEVVDASDGPLKYNGRTIKDIVYIYCVGSRQTQGEDDPNLYCSRYCCTTAVHTALCAYERDPDLHQFHLFRDMRTYGKHEVSYEEACTRGAVFLRFEDDKPPKVDQVDGRLRVQVRDQLTGDEELEIESDVVVLVTGMVPAPNENLVRVLKLPVGRDGFFNEIHPKLRPVETVVDGIFIAGAAQGPKTLPESVASALSGVSKSAGLLMKGYVDLEPFIAKIDPERCVWCGACAKACPYDAIEKTSSDGREIAQVIQSLCKGGGGCVPVCTKEAIDIEGYTDTQVKAMIDALAQEVA